MDTSSDLARPLNSAKPAYWITPARCMFALLLIEATLYASEQFQWFAFSRHKNWTVLVAVGVAAGGLLIVAGWFAIRALQRRAIQFDLATMLWLVAIFAIVLPWFEQARQRASSEQVALSWLRGQQGAWYYRTQALTGRYSAPGWTGASPLGATFTMIRPSPSEPAWLRNWMGDEFFDSHTRNVRLGDRFPFETNFIRQAPYVDEKLHLTDEEVSHLLHFRDLEYLEISSRKITDAGLRSLYGLRNLRVLTLVTPNVTPEGVEELRRNLPACKIIQYDDIVETGDRL